MLVAKPLYIRCDVCRRAQKVYPSARYGCWLPEEETAYGTLKTFDLWCAFGSHRSGHQLIELVKEVAA
jgi:hypothetical protein